MMVTKNPEPSRPPGQYIPAEGTQHCLVANEYDKNTYAQCSYIGNRTLIRCKQIRSKEDMAKNNGICEEHEIFRQRIKRNYQKEMLRLHAECDSQQTKKRRYNPTLVADEWVSDEDEWLQPASTLSVEFPEQIYENAVDDDMFRHAGVYTDKDILKMRLNFLKRDIQEISNFRMVLKARALRRYEAIMTSQSKSTSLEFTQQRMYEAMTGYGKSDCLFAGSSQPRNREFCRYGHVDEADNDSVVNHVMEKLICVLEKTPIPRPCHQFSLPASKFCIHHIHRDKNQSLFTGCCVCAFPAMNTEQPFCMQHQIEYVRTRALDPFHNTREHYGGVKFEVEQEKKKASVTVASHAKKIVIDEPDEETLSQERITALLRHAESQIAASGAAAQRRRPPPGPYVQRPATYNPSAVSYVHGKPQLQPRTPAPARSLAPPMPRPAMPPPVARPLDEVAAKRIAAQMAETMKCARERPFHPDFFGDRRRMPPFTTTTVRPMPPVRPLQSGRYSGPTPRILPSSLKQQVQAPHVIRATTPLTTSAALAADSRPSQPRYTFIRPSAGVGVRDRIPSTSNFVSPPRAAARPPIVAERPDINLTEMGAVSPASTNKSESISVTADEEELVEDRKTPPPQSQFPRSRPPQNIVRGVTGPSRTFSAILHRTAHPRPPQVIRAPGSRVTDLAPTLQIQKTMPHSSELPMNVLETPPKKVAETTSSSAPPKDPAEAHVQQPAETPKIISRVSINVSGTSLPQPPHRLMNRIGSPSVLPQRLSRPPPKRAGSTLPTQSLKILPKDMPQLAAEVPPPELAPAQKDEEPQKPADPEEDVDRKSSLRTRMSDPTLVKPQPKAPPTPRKTKEVPATPPTSARTPRAAAVAANQAINTKKSPAVVTPKAQTSKSEKPPAENLEMNTSSSESMDPLSMLAAVSLADRDRSSKSEERKEEQSSSKPTSTADASQHTDSEDYDEEL
ncbi:unnamed protein product [Caenorhabditis auriculariae]|uniref:KANL2-like probable zinc-finger domain-containing protein n=1 Tax=Caenorhabditis auriculariae TaxID=2777116 RepID=A0A8S1H4E6_9PELO|nr:unnamed protein product [Caenorhabditis auriculariae]